MKSEFVKNSKLSFGERLKKLFKTGVKIPIQILVKSYFPDKEIGPILKKF